MKHFFHSGDLGDIIYSLPAVRAMGGGVIHLKDEPGVGTTHSMTMDRFKSIAPLLEAQDYVFGTMWSYPPADAVNLNAFRRMGHCLHTTWLPLQYLRANDLPDCLAEAAWLDPLPKWMHKDYPFLIARSSRYHNPDFPWKKVLEKYGEHCGFLGTAAEHVSFNLEFDANLPHLKTESLWSVAMEIAGCNLFIGNQSAPLAIAEGLKKPIVCEVSTTSPNCNSPRKNFWDGRLFLPDIMEESIRAI